MLDALLPLDCTLFRKSQPWRFYAGPTLALELSGSTAWLAGHANPAELAGFLSFCGCESAILDGTVCPPPDGWHKAEALTVFGLPQAGPLPLPAVDEALWAQLSLCREAPAARVAAALYPADPARQADFTQNCAQSAAGAGQWRGHWSRGVQSSAPWALMPCAMGRHIWPVGRPQSRCGAKASAGGSLWKWQTALPPKAAPGVPLCTGAGAVLYPPWLCKTGRVRPLCAREMLKLLAQRTQ